MKTFLGVRMDRRAFGRLGCRAALWGGRLRLVGPREYDRLTERETYSEAPFSSANLGVDYKARLIAYEGPLSSAEVAEVIHEMAHVFASMIEPARSEEYDFLGWELAMAEDVGLPLWAWRQSNRDYGLGPEHTVGDLTLAELKEVRNDRLEAARALGLISKEGRPLCIRD